MQFSLSFFFAHSVVIILHVHDKMKHVPDCESVRSLIIINDKEISNLIVLICEYILANLLKNCIFICHRASKHSVNVFFCDFTTDVESGHVVVNHHSWRY